MCWQAEVGRETEVDITIIDSSRIELQDLFVAEHLVRLLEV